jgi:hypothetical protein
MTKSARSPILGYNHNIMFHGRVFHVQTEDSGVVHARVFTHLFFEGTILASKKHEYEVEALEDAVRLHMQRLHKAMIKELKEGLHDPRILAFFTARGEHVTLGDRPSLVQMPIVGGVPAVAPVIPLPSAVSAPAAALSSGVPDRPLAVSGSIEAVGQPRRGDSPAPVVTAAPPPARRPVVVVKSQELRRPPVVVSSSAEGVVIKRNVVINVGGGVGPVQGQISRGTAVPRPAVPYVVREGSYPMPTVSRGSIPHVAGAQPPPVDGSASPLSGSSARDVRMPWDGGSPGPTTQGATQGATTTGAVRRPTGVPSEHTPQGRALGVPDAALRTRTPSAPSERTPAERAFASDLSNDKSLDEVILEYLSDDAE